MWIFLVCITGGWFSFALRLRCPWFCSPDRGWESPAVLASVPSSQDKVPLAFAEGFSRVVSDEGRGVPVRSVLAMSPSWCESCLFAWVGQMDHSAACTPCHGLGAAPVEGRGTQWEALPASRGTCLGGERSQGTAPPSQRRIPALPVVCGTAEFPPKIASPPQGFVNLEET